MKRNAHDPHLESPLNLLRIHQPFADQNTGDGLCQATPYSIVTLGKEGRPYINS